MKKKLLIMLLAMLMLLQFCACGTQGSGTDHSGKASETVSEESSTAKNKKPVILVDEQNLKNEFRLLWYAQYLYPGYNATVKLLSQSSEKREMELSSMRAEIMAGGGPDAFILSTYVPGILLDDGNGYKEPLFTNVEKTMRSGIFLPLDDLIAQSEYLNMEDHYEVIMNAGKTDEGQMVLPLTYSCSAYFVYKSQLEDPNMELNRWEDVLNCGDEKTLEFLRLRAAFGWFGDQYTQYADYESENLLITPEELADDIKAFTDLPLGGISEEDPFEMPYTQVFSEWSLEAWAENPEDAYILTVPNKEGGLTANITSYAAINRNSECAEEVFKLLELFYSDEVQNNEGIVTGDPMEGGRYFGNASRPGYALARGQGVATGKKAYPEAEAALVADLTAKINAVRFYSELDCAINETGGAATWRGIGKDDEYFQKTAEKICDEMEMMLAE